MLNVKLRTMKIKNLLKFLMTFTAILTVSMSMAQDHPPYTEMTKTAPSNHDTVTVNTKMLYYVEPDPALNNLDATYDTTWDRNTAENTHNVYSTFGFAITGTGAGSADIHTPDAWAEAPYRVLYFTGTGELTLEATETYETPGGATTCPGTSSTLPIYVASEPSFTVGSTDPIEVCQSAGNTEDITISSYSVEPQGGRVYFKMDIDVYNDTNGDGTFDTEETGMGETDKIVKINNPDDGSGISTTVLADYSIETVNDQPTRYRFDFGNNIGAGQDNGINDYISRKSDYLENGNPTNDADYTYYPAGDGTETDKMVTYIVYPAPTTQPIYHIENQHSWQ
jgi:hypothetical protein